MLKAIIHVRLKSGVLDPQGQAIGNALRGLGYAGVGEVRQGKVIEVEIDETDHARAEAAASEMCERLLANQVIETYDVEIAA